MNLRRSILSLWLPATVLAAWEACVAWGFLDSLFFPPPSRLLAEASRLVRNGELTTNLQATLVRLAAGFGVGSALGLLCGVLMGAFKPVRNSLEPLVSGLNSTPKLSLLPMLMLLLGVGETARVVLVAAACFVTLAIHGLDAVRGINRHYVDVARNYDATPVSIFRKVYLPASLPSVFTGMRLALGRALTITVGLELVSCPDGLGSMIWMAWQTFSTEKLYVGVITAALTGVIFHHLLGRLEARLIPWKR